MPISAQHTDSYGVAGMEIAIVGPITAGIKTDYGWLTLPDGTHLPR